MATRIVRLRRRSARAESRPSRGLERALGGAIAASGLFLMLLYLRVVPWTRVNRCRAVFCDPYHWQVLIYGIAFLGAGLLCFVPPGRAEIGRPVALVTVLAFLAALIGTMQAL